jgi:hypothetical protein
MAAHLDGPVAGIGHGDGFRREADIGLDGRGVGRGDDFSGDHEDLAIWRLSDVPIVISGHACAPIAKSLNRHIVKFIESGGAR